MEVKLLFLVCSGYSLAVNGLDTGEQIYKSLERNQDARQTDVNDKQISKRGDKQDPYRPRANKENLRLRRQTHYPYCKAFDDVKACDPNYPYRTADGTCNNLQHPAWGAVTCPLTRDISHEEGTYKECCYEVNESRTRCFKIHIPDDGSYFTKTCIDFVESTSMTTRTEISGVKERLNEITTYIDGSNVYGSTLETTNALRTSEGGLLKTSSGETDDENDTVSSGEQENDSGSTDTLMKYELNLNTKEYASEKYNNSKLNPTVFNKIAVFRLFEADTKNEQDIGPDVVALNIQRGRDHGLPTYINWRTNCGIEVANMTKDGDFFLPDHKETETRKLEQVYRHVDEIDLFVGAMTETLLPNSKVGPTFACLIGDQFRKLKNGDRFWFETQDKIIMFSKDLKAKYQEISAIL